MSPSPISLPGGAGRVAGLARAVAAFGAIEAITTGFDCCAGAGVEPLATSVGFACDAGICEASATGFCDGAIVTTTAGWWRNSNGVSLNSPGFCRGLMICTTVVGIGTLRNFGSV